MNKFLLQIVLIFKDSIFLLWKVSISKLAFLYIKDFNSSIFQKKKSKTNHCKIHETTYQCTMYDQHDEYWFDDARPKCILQLLNDAFRFTFFLLFAEQNFIQLQGDREIWPPQPCNGSPCFFQIPFLDQPNWRLGDEVTQCKE